MKTMRLTRRGLMAGAAATALAAPAIAAGDQRHELRFIPSVDLGFLDPIVTMTNVTRNHAGLVFDQLYGTDSKYQAQPQMVDGHVVEDNGLTWRMTLRDGLWWHDGEKVLARDCVASIRRWAKRDALGAEIIANSNEISTPDDKTIVFRLKRRYPRLPEALGKPNSYWAAMMPERLASLDPFKQVPELIGSGPLRYVASERMQGVRNVYARFDKYVPRPNGVPDRGAGPKVVHFERVVWTTIPDQSTAFAALQKGEQDWWEFAAHDMRPLIRKDSRLRSAVLDSEGEVVMVRFNHTIPPFSDPAMRRTILRAINQEDFVNAVAGDDPELQRIGIGVFPPGLPAANDAGLAALKPLLTAEEAGKALRAAGYKGERIVQLAPADYPNVNAASEVLGDLLKRMGVNVDYQSIDWATMSARMQRHDPIESGGFHLHMLAVPGLTLATPMLNGRLRATGTATESGWYKSDRFEDLRREWMDAEQPEQQRALERAMQEEALQTVAYAPGGQTFQPSAWRSDIEGILPGVAKFWNVRRV